jgi:hypothetical protein
MKKVTVEVKLEVLVHVDEDVDFEAFMAEMGYMLVPNWDGGDVMDVQLENYTVKESR